MPPPPTTAADSVRLTPGEADRLWNHVLTRQGLAPGARLATVEQAAQAALGLHAARLLSPFATAAARTGDAVLALHTPRMRSRLVTVRCMRKTLHMLPPDLASAAHGATRHFRERDALRALTNHGHTPATLAPATEALMGLLGEHGPLHHRTIETRLAPLPTADVRLALKLAWEQGRLVYTNTSPRWNREHRTFDLAGRAHPGLDTGLDRPTATRRLVAAYFDRYGPASIRDAAWWSGLSAPHILGALEEEGTELVELHIPWGPDPLYMSAERFEDAAATGGGTTGIHLLAHEDVALKAYFHTRARYLGALPQRKAFNRIGEALPTVCADGKVVGTWTWDAKARRVRHRLLPGLLARDRHPEVRRAAADLTRLLNAALDG